MAVVSRPKITVSADTVTTVKILEVTTSVTSGAEGFYSTDQVTWIKIEGNLYLTENGVYYFKAVKPENGLESNTYTTLEVNNIDNTAPSLEITRDIEGMTNKDITLTANASDGTIEYYDGSKWVAGNTLTVSQNGTYTFRATDAVGNVTEKSVVVDKIDMSAELTVSNVLNGNNVDIFAASDEGTVEYYNGHEWVACNFRRRHLSVPRNRCCRKYG